MVTHSPLRWLGAVLLLALSAQAAQPIDPKALPPEQQRNFETFQVRCSKCHTVDKPLNQRMSVEGWRRYVAKMQRRPGSGINDANGAQILAFLTYLESQRAAAEAADK